jgi:hypothetical protein
MAIFGRKSVMKIQLYHLTIAMLATAATISTASANPRMGGGVYVPQVNAPRGGVSINHGNPGAGAAAAAAQSAVNAARGAGTGAMPFGPSVGGIENAPRSGNTGGVGQAGLAGRIAAAGGVTVNPAPEPGSQSDALAEVMITSVMANGPKKDQGTSASDGKSGSGTKVANTDPTTGTTSTATSTSLPGPTGGTTTTASVPGDPPDAKKPLTPAEHQALVDNATRLQEETTRLNNVVIDLTELVNRATDGTMTEAQKADLVRRGGVDAVNKQIIDTSNQSRATDNERKRAHREAQNNDSYRHVH